MTPTAARPPWYVSGLIALLWTAVQVALIAGYGFSDGGDSGRYYGGAESILEGERPVNKGTSYLGYILFLTSFVALGLDRVAIGIAQILVSGIALVCLYRLAEHMYGTRAALAACVLFVAFPDVHYWNLIVYSDSLYTSMLLIASCVLVVSRSVAGRAFGVLLALYACTVRPNGVAYVAALLAFLLVSLWWSGRRRLFTTITLGLMMLLPLAWWVLGGMLAMERPLDRYISGEVIWGYTENAMPLDPDRLPDGLGDMHPLLAIASYAMAEPGHFLRLASAKLFYFFLHLRPYFTTLHNLLSLAILIPLYLFTMIGLSRTRSRDRPAVVLLLTTCLLQATIVALTFADWDARHLIPVYPLFAVFAGAGVAWWWAWLIRTVVPGRLTAHKHRAGQECRQRRAATPVHERAEGKRLRGLERTASKTCNLSARGAPPTPNPERGGDSPLSPRSG